MDIYLQSCGQKGTQDYRWLKIQEDDNWLQNPERVDPPFINKLIKTRINTQVEFSNFYTPSTPAVVLARNNQELMLLIYWLRTKKRSLDYGRPVQNSLALISKKEDDHLLLQRLASKALENWNNSSEKENSFAQTIDVFVQWGDNKYGFQVEQDLFINYINSVREEADSQKREEADSQKPEHPDQKRKLACDVLNVNSKSPEKQKIFQETKQQWIKKLADELEKHLPDWDGPLVVVAENVSEDVLKPVVWRGISDRVEHNNESGRWKEIVEGEVKKKSGTAYIILAIILISLLVILAVVFSLDQPQKNPNPQPSLPTQTQLSPTPPMIPEAEIQASPKPQMTPEAEIQPSPNPQIEVLPTFQVNIYLRYTHL